ncbi:SRPBCC family protein [Nocardia sp. NPDC055029]
MKVRAFKQVPLPVDVVWQTLIDHEGMSEWSPGIQVTLERPGDSDRHGVGAIRRVKGPGVTIREEVTNCETERWLAYRVLSGLPLRNYRGEVFLSGRGDGCTISWMLMCDNRSALLRIALDTYANIFLYALVRAARRRVLVRK